jgi:CheY-like chemotaxis protein
VPQSKSILVVDDERKIVDVVQSYLELAGYKVFSAYSGKDALELFDKLSPALVVLDLMLSPARRSAGRSVGSPGRPLSCSRLSPPRRTF